MQFHPPPSIYFYIPKPYWPRTMPKSAGDDWKGLVGLYGWTLKTYLYLKENDFPCTLTKEWPDEGIVLIHRDSFQAFKRLIKPSSRLLLVCIKAEWEPYPYAQIQVVQNPDEVGFSKESYYIQYWPQGALIPRNAERGDRFENVAFLGNPENLAPELKAPSWPAQLRELGLSWHPITDRNCWNDYGEIDAVLAVRSFDRRQLYLTRNFMSKPATKLYNAWRAGVPAILGCESAFRAERNGELDYLEVTAVEDAIAALQRLKDNPDWRRKMVENGRLRSREIEADRVVERWKTFLTDVAVPAYENWRAKSGWERELFFRRRYFQFKMNRARHKIRKQVAKLVVK